MYAERLVRKTDGSAWAMSSRAYVRALVGLHAAAAADIQQARDRFAKASHGEPLPEWVETIDLFCHGKIADLAADAKTESQRKLASILGLLLVENTGYDYRIDKDAQTVLNQQPDCFRAFQARYEVPILAVEQEIIPAGPSFLFKSVVARLAGVPGLPEPVREKLDTVRNAKSTEAQVASWLETVAAHLRVGPARR